MQLSYCVQILIIMTFNFDNYGTKIWYICHDQMKGKNIAEVQKCTTTCDDILIPWSITYRSKVYDVKCICKNAFNKSKIKLVQVPYDSMLEVIENRAFSMSSIEKLVIPSSLVDLKKDGAQIHQN